MSVVTSPTFLWSLSSGHVHLGIPNTGDRFNIPQSLDAIDDAGVKYFKRCVAVKGGVTGTLAEIQSITMSNTTIDFNECKRHANTSAANGQPEAVQMLRKLTTEQERPYVIGSVAIKIEDKDERKAVMEAVQGMTFKLHSETRVIVYLGGQLDTDVDDCYKARFEEGKLSAEVVNMMFTGEDTT